MADEIVFDESQQPGEVGQPFEEKMLERVNADYKKGKDFMAQIHRACLESYRLYHNALEFETLRSKYSFPVPFFQEQIDRFVADCMDKLFYSGRPALVVPTEGTPKEDADVKQSILDWQDYRDKRYSTLKKLVKDSALYRFCVVAVDYAEKSKTVIKSEREPLGVETSEGFIPHVDEMGQPAFRNVTYPLVEYSYKGAHAKRIDPMNFFVTQEKSDIDDEHPVMIRSEMTLSGFSAPYYINQDKVKSSASKGSADNMTDDKRFAIGLSPDAGRKSNSYEYVEWQGKVSRLELLQYLAAKNPEQYPEEVLAGIDPSEECWCICGVVNEKVVARLQEHFTADGPNIRIGVIDTEEDELIGMGIAQKIVAVQKGLQALTGILIENLKQSVNAWTVIDKSKLVDQKEIKVNQAGGVLLVNADPRLAMMRVEQPKVAPDLYNVLSLMTQWGKDASGLQNPILSKPDSGSDTLGEFSALAGQASLTMRDYLKSLEDTLIQPMYELCNQINMLYLDTPFVYGIVGETGIAWQQATQSQINAGVDFVCQAATRETNRAVLTQQMLSLSKVAPAAESAGFPIRWDKLFEQLCELGFTWTNEKTESIFPTLKLEKQGVDIDQILLQKFMIMQQAQSMMAATTGAMAGQVATGGPMSAPMTEGDAVQSANEQSQTDVRQV